MEECCDIGRAEFRDYLNSGETPGQVHDFNWAGGRTVTSWVTLSDPWVYPRSEKLKLNLHHHPQSFLNNTSLTRLYLPEDPFYRARAAKKKDASVVRLPLSWTPLVLILDGVRYQARLAARPLLTQSITTGVNSTHCRPSTEPADEK